MPDNLKSKEMEAVESLKAAIIECERLDHANNVNIDVTFLSNVEYTK